MPHVEVMVGSLSDLPHLKASKLIPALKEAGFTVKVSVCSAHRNEKELDDRINSVISYTNAFVTAAGMSAALPGVTKAKLLRRSLAVVFGIGLPSKKYPDGMDAQISIKELPPGIDVVYGGVGTAGFNRIIDQVIAAANAYDPANPDKALLDQVISKIKDPMFDINLEEV